MAEPQRLDQIVGKPSSRNWPGSAARPARPGFGEFAVQAGCRWSSPASPGCSGSLPRRPARRASAPPRSAGRAASAPNMPMNCGCSRCTNMAARSSGTPCARRRQHSWSSTSMARARPARRRPASRSCRRSRLAIRAPAAQPVEPFQPHLQLGLGALAGRRDSSARAPCRRGNSPGRRTGRARRGRRRSPGRSRAASSGPWVRCGCGAAASASRAPWPSAGPPCRRDSRRSTWAPAPDRRCLRQRQLALGRAQLLERLGRGQGQQQRLRVGEADILDRHPHQPAGEVARVLAALRACGRASRARHRDRSRGPICAAR